MANTPLVGSIASAAQWGAAFPTDIDAWDTYTPTLVQNVAVTKTVTHARFMKVGRLVVYAVSLSCTGAGTAGQPVRIGLPSAAVISDLPCGGGLIYDQSATTVYNGHANIYTGGLEVALWPSADGTATFLGQRGFVAALAATDLVRVSGWYESAS